MYTKQIRTPLSHQILFLAILLLPPAILIGFTTEYTSASPIDCRQAFYDGFFQEIQPVMKLKCGKKFEYYTRKEIQRMNNFANFK